MSVKLDLWKALAEGQLLLAVHVRQGLHDLGGITHRSNRSWVKSKIVTVLQPLLRIDRPSISAALRCSSGLGHLRKAQHCYVCYAHNDARRCLIFRLSLQVEDSSQIPV